ncbi:MAG TPA: hypothetical protein VEK11_12870 [Thermoanaerobaculia bacterium]|nr:hypothetical protein [Thermoanaerobaculia bacterium]
MSAADRQKIAAINVSATAVVTLASCYVQKHARTWREAGRCLGIGAIAGAGFYQAKRFAGRGDITEGWLLANAATSLVENTTAGEHPLGRIGYTFGPFRLRLVTPLDRARESIVDIDVSLAETIYLARMLNDADDVDVRDGMLWWETRDPVREDDRLFLGYTWGIYPGAWTRARETTWNHEAVHAVQALQTDSVDPPAITLAQKPRPIRFRHLRLGALNLADNVVHAQLVDYEDRWAEIEAYRLSGDEAPPR